MKAFNPLSFEIYVVNLLFQTEDVSFTLVWSELRKLYP